MRMYGDPTTIRRLAAGLREQAGEIRAEADRLVARTDAAGWLGRGGDALRDRAASEPWTSAGRLACTTTPPRPSSGTPTRWTASSG